MGYPCCSANPAATTFAEAPINVPLPPRQQPNDKAHTSGVNGNPKSESARPATTGIIVVVKGMLSMNAETNAETQIINKMATANRPSPPGTFSTTSG